MTLQNSPTRWEQAASIAAALRATTAQIPDRATVEKSIRAYRRIVALGISPADAVRMLQSNPAVKTARGVLRRDASRRRAM